MNRLDVAIYLIVVGAMFLDWISAARAFNDGNICEGLQCFAGIVLLGLGYIVALLREIRDQRRKQ